MRRSFTFYVERGDLNDEQFRSRVDGTVAAVQEILDGIDLDDCVAVYDRAAGKIGAASKEEAFLQIADLPFVKDFSEARYAGCKIALKIGTSETDGRKQVGSVLERMGVENLRMEFSNVAGLPNLHTGPLTKDVANAIERLSVVEYVMPDYVYGADPIPEAPVPKLRPAP